LDEGPIKIYGWRSN